MFSNHLASATQYERPCGHVTDSFALTHTHTHTHFSYRRVYVYRPTTYNVSFVLRINEKPNFKRFTMFKGPLDTCDGRII